MPKVFPNAAKKILLFVFHVLVSTAGVIVGAVTISYSLIAAVQQVYAHASFRSASWILTETPFFPVQILLGLVWGFVWFRRFRHDVMFWAWTVPTAVIIGLILFAPLSPTTASGIELTPLEHFFGWKCLPQNRCFEQVGFTLPFYSACAYSLGAFMARGLNGPAPLASARTPGHPV